MRQNYQISEQFPSMQEEEALEFPIFARKNYWLLHLKEEELWPFTVRDQKHDIIAFWCFCRIEDRFVTPFKAPFFTPHLADIEQQEILFSKVIHYLSEKYTKPIQFSLNSNLNFQKLQDLVPFLTILNIEVGTYLYVAKDSFFEQILQKRKRRKLNSILREDTFEILEVSDHDWNKVYQQNLIWRREKGHRNTMKLEDMAEAKRQFPQHYHAFQLLRGEELMGTAFFLNVHHDLVYVYSLVTAPSTAEKEPALLLWKAIYDWAKHNQISCIDMGTSMASDREINKNLLRYKQFIGGLIYRKYTFEC
ncbi:hypothetical protein SAMN05661096_00163 [Marivirga sericea]|uniref:Acetyltransferase (GNAT) domain-containing protein n=1 Tax=Marivirga sericea TaxID=1028 RepID=A0A1X7I3M6_9BACT|nr:hypothetical protein [Marivirga sericea]SMG08767.1 hypothetical protein SAMN05661096_00163 [Marivirga sericea]